MANWYAFGYRQTQSTNQYLISICGRKTRY
ncbi:MAG: hypothetical protein DWP95_04910 [Proteobacteria bacterium]|nr:MAG: hypothetical protein DWP95_04910 [Pseudomonadota bacterium]